MIKTSTVKASLVGNASALGLNWIYDSKFLKEYTKTNDPLFHEIDESIYKKAKPSFYVYPNHKLGDVGYMGEVLHLLYKTLESNKDLSQVEWLDTLFNYIKPGGIYSGYVESSGVQIVLNYLNTLINKQDKIIKANFEDKQLIGLIPLLAVYDLDYIKNKAEYAATLAKTMTSYKEIITFNKLLINIFDNIKLGRDKIEVLLDSIKLAPEFIQEKLSKAIDTDDTQKFIKEHSGLACYLELTLPLIFHIISHTNTVKEALTLNASLGGASSARGLFIGAIYNLITGINVEYLEMLNYKL